MYRRAIALLLLPLFLSAATADDADLIRRRVRQARADLQRALRKAGDRLGNRMAAQALEMVVQRRLKQLERELIADLSGGQARPEGSLGKLGKQLVALVATARASAIRSGRPHHLLLFASESRIQLGPQTGYAQRADRYLLVAGPATQGPRRLPAHGGLVEPLTGRSLDLPAPGPRVIGTTRLLPRGMQFDRRRGNHVVTFHADGTLQVEGPPRTAVLQGNQALVLTFRAARGDVAVRLSK